MAAPKRIKKKSNSTLPILLGAVVLLGASTYMYMSSFEDPAVTAAKKQEAKPMGKIAVPVLKTDLARGTAVSNNNFTSKYLFPEEVPDNIIISDKVFKGRWLVSAMKKGDYIREENLAAEGAPKGFSGMLQKGKRIAVLPVKGIVGATGYLQVGDIVDIYTTGKIGGAVAKASQTTSGNQPGQAALVNKHNAAKQSASGSNVAHLLASAAEVVSIPKKTREGGLENVVLSVDIDESYNLMFAASGSDLLQFIYRPFGEDTDEPEAFIQATSDPRLVDVIKGVQRKNVMTQLDK